MKKNQSTLAKVRNECDEWRERAEKLARTLSRIAYGESGAQLSVIALNEFSISKELAKRRC